MTTAKQLAGSSRLKSELSFALQELTSIQASSVADPLEQISTAHRSKDVAAVAHQLHHQAAMAEEVDDAHGGVVQECCWIPEAWAKVCEAELHAEELMARDKKSRRVC